MEDKIFVDLVECPCCFGEKYVTRPPYYSIPMPKEEKEQCQRCNGKGVLYVAPHGYKKAEEMTLRKDVEELQSGKG